MRMRIIELVCMVRAAGFNNTDSIFYMQYIDFGFILRYSEEHFDVNEYDAHACTIYMYAKSVSVELTFIPRPIVI